MNDFHYAPTSTGFSVLTTSGFRVGDIERDVDGFYYFWPAECTGCWGGSGLRTLADKLDELNKPWQDEITKSQ